MAQEISGVVYKVLPSQTGTGKKGGWVKQIFIIETKDQYPKKIAFMAWNDKCDLIPKEGTEVTVSYNPESREYNEKWYTDLSVWKIDVVGAESKKPEKVAKAPVKTGLDITTEDDDLPF
jgi:hypothetical protein